jgi:predicted PurR-regulated permease PerM
LKEEKMQQPVDRNLWEMRALRQLFLVGALVTVVVLAYQIRAILIPIGIAFLFSYAADPPVSYLQRRLGLHRGISAVGCLLLAGGVLTLFSIWAVPNLSGQVNQLVERIPKYAQILRSRMGESAQVMEFVEKLKDLLATGWPKLFGLVGDAISTTAYLALSLALIIVFFYIFVTHRGWTKPLQRLLPRHYEDKAGKVVGYMDLALGAYVRGQLLVALFTFSGFCIGFSLAGVPDSLVVASIGGVFSLVPYGQVLGPVLAISLKFMESQVDGGAFSWGAIFLGPLLVYSVTQSLETWVITPLVQGEINKLHPMVILTVLILGGALGGVIGLVLAIPVAATIRASVQEFCLQPEEKVPEAGPDP